MKFKSGDKKICGDTQVFAMEFELTAVKPQLMGHVCLWFAGKKVGYFGEENMLGVVEGVLLSLVERQRTLVNDEFVKMSPSAVFELVKSDKILDNGKYFFSPGEAFDDFSIICFADEDRLHFIWSLYDDPFFEYEDVEPGIHSAVVPLSVYKKVVDEFVKGSH